MNKFLSALIVLLCFSPVFAGNFTPGNLVVLRVGDGSAALASTSTAVFLDEYTTAGVLVQSIPVPTSPSGSNHALTLSGVATSEGLMTLSANGQYLSFAGFDTTVGYAGVSTGVTNRTIARVDASGTINTTTGYTAGSAYAGGNFRDAVSNDGSGFWTSGSSSGSSGGIWYQPFGSFNSSGTQTSTTYPSVRSVNIFGGQLYFTTGTAGGMGQDGTGLPTTSGQTETFLPGISAGITSPYTFLMVNENGSTTPNVLYLTDDDNSGVGGVYKFSLISGTWVANGQISNSGVIRGITGYSTCSGVFLYLTSPTGGIYTMTDNSGFNQTITGTFTNIVSPGANTATKGIAFAPGSVTPTPPVVSIQSKSNVSCHGDANGAITISVAGGTAPLTYEWTGGDTSRNRSSLIPGTYDVTITDAYGCTSTTGTTISQPNALALTDSITNLPCAGGGNTGAIRIAVTGGTGTYTYHWNNSATSQNLSSLAAGPYSVTVTDSAHCTIVDSFTVSQSGSMSYTDSVVRETCYGSSNGSIHIFVTGGTPGYRYLWSNADTMPVNNNITAGTYDLTITDHGGCTLIENLSVGQPDSLALVLTPSEATPFGASNGSIALGVTGGTPGYSYIWSNSGTQAYDSNLTANVYCVTVTDLHGCRDSNCTTVSQTPNGINEAGWINALTVYAAAGNININLSLPEEMNISAEIYDLTGKQIYRNTASYGTRFDIQIPDAPISSGCYIIRIVSDQGSVCRKVVLIK